jgi:hypothetical protein
MITDAETIIELHSQECRCKGQGWFARRKTSAARSTCCRARDGLTPAGALWVDSALWLLLGMPHTVEQYRRAESERREAELAGRALSVA